MSRRERRDMVLVTVVLAASAGVLGWAQSARASTNDSGPRRNDSRAYGPAVQTSISPLSASQHNPPCQVTGHLVAEPGHVTAVFTVAATCREVSVLSWLAPDAHAGNPQVLYDRRSETDVAPGDYRWTITRPADDCFQQSDLRVPGHNVDAIVGGEHQCQTPPPVSTSIPTTTTTTSPPTTTTTEATTTSTSPMGRLGSTPTPTTVSTSGLTNREELPHSGNGEVGAMTAAALVLIGAGRWLEWRGRRRRAGL